MALSYEGTPFAVAKAVGKRSKALTLRLGDAAEWRSVDETPAQTAASVLPALQRHIDEANAAHRTRIDPLDAERLAMRERQSDERAALEREQEARRMAEAQERAARLRRGVLGLWDRLTGRRAETIRQNEIDQQVADQRDRDQREAIIAAQLNARRKLQTHIVAERERHAEEVRDIHRDVERYQQLSPGYQLNLKRLRRSRTFRTLCGRSFSRPRNRRLQRHMNRRRRSYSRLTTRWSGEPTKGC